jgi:hypothetical protein
MAINRALFTNWIAGQTFTARAYVYERKLILDELDRLAAIVRGQALFTGTDTPTDPTSGDIWMDTN